MLFISEEYGLKYCNGNIYDVQNSIKVYNILSVTLSEMQKDHLVSIEI